MFEKYPEVLTKELVAEILQCKPESVYEMTRARSQARQTHPLPFLKLPCGIRFRKSAIITWLDHLSAGAA
jgi:hypothetical protein